MKRKKGTILFSCIALFAVLVGMLYYVEFYRFPFLRLAWQNRGLYHTIWTHSQTVYEGNILECYVTEHNGRYVTAFYLRESGTNGSFKLKQENYERSWDSSWGRIDPEAYQSLPSYAELLRMGRSTWEESRRTYHLNVWPILEETPEHFVGSKDVDGTVWILSEDIDHQGTPVWVMFAYTTDSDRFGCEEIRNLLLLEPDNSAE